MGIAAQSEQRYRRLFDRHSPEVFAYCRRRTDAETAADCAAETFLVAWRRLDDVPEGDAALGWLYGVARRVLANEFRRNRRSRRLLGKLRRNDPETEPTPEVVVLRRERDRTMLAALARLRPDDQELLRLAWWDGLSHAQIGEVMGCSPQTASQRIHRAARRVARPPLPTRIRAISDTGSLPPVTLRPRSHHPAAGDQQPLQRADQRPRLGRKRS